MNSILWTAYISICVQLLTALISFFGLFVELKAKDIILRDILVLELAVQVIEFIFYIWLILALQDAHEDVTSVRYFDWIWTTPIMLLTTVYYFEYNTSLYTTKDEINRRDYLYLFYICLANWCMLALGYLGEIRAIDKAIALFGGGVFFMLTFYLLYIKYTKDNLINHIVFYSMFFIWALYGFAFCFPYSIKNKMYNILDIFSKNIYSLFIFMVIINQ